MKDFLDDALLYSISMLYICIVAFAIGMIIGYLL